MKSLRPVTLSQVISYEFCEIAKNIFLTEHVLATASINITILVKIILLSSTCSVRFTCQVFSCEFCEVSKKPILTEHLRWLLPNVAETWNLKNEIYHTKSPSRKGILHFEEKDTVKAMSKGG